MTSSLIRHLLADMARERKFTTCSQKQSSFHFVVLWFVYNNLVEKCWGYIRLDKKENGEENRLNIKTRSPHLISSFG